MSQKDALLYARQACCTRGDEGAAGKPASYLRGGGSGAACGVQRGSSEEGVLPLMYSVLLIVW